MSKKGPYMPNLQDLYAAGIDPHTGLPLKLIGGKPEYLVEDAMRSFRLIDEQNALNRFNWINLPDGLSGNLLERILYYKGQGAFAFIEDLDGETGRFVFLPFTLAATKEGTSGLDIYGRFKEIQLIQFMGSTEKESALMLGTPFKARYDIQLKEQKAEDLTKSAVILRDYSQQLSQTVLPTQLRQEWILRIMAETTAYLRTKLIIGTGINGVRVNSADQIQDVKDLADGVAEAAQTGSPYVGIAGGIELQGLENINGGTMRSEDYLMALQSLDNIRLSTYGLDNGGIFEKKAHITNDELAMNGSSVGLVYQDALSRRQEFCDIVNSIWGLNIDCVPSENVIGTDLNGDGIIADEENASVETPVSANNEEEAPDDATV